MSSSCEATSAYGPPRDDCDPHRPQLGGGAHTVVMVAQVAQPVCELTRGELDGYLRESRYGKDEAAFACYFTREHPSAPPLCIACGHRSADHPKGRDAQQQQCPMPPKTQNAEPAPVATAAAAAPAVDPSNLVAGSDLDASASWNSLGFFFTAGVMVLIGVILSIVFSSVEISEFAMVGPAAAFAISIGFMMLGKKTTIRFHVGGSRRGDVDVLVQRLVTWCCPAERTVRVTDLSNVRPVQTSMRVNRSYIYEVTCDIAANEEDVLVLHSSFYSEALAESKLWAAYLAKLQRQ